MNDNRFRVIKLAQQIDKKGIKWIILKCLVDALVSYWLILMPSLIISLLYKEINDLSLWISTGLILGIFAVLKLISVLLKKINDNHKNFMIEKYRELKIKKAFSIEFKWLETSEFEKTLQGIQYNDENLAHLGTIWAS